MPKGTYLKDAQLSAVLRGVAHPAVASVDVALFRGDATEVTGGGYARKNMVANTTNFGAPVDNGAGVRQVSNLTVIDFGSATADWSTDANRITEVRVYSGGTANLLYSTTKDIAGVNISKIVQSGDPVTIPVGQIAFREIDVA